MLGTESKKRTWVPGGTDDKDETAERAVGVMVWCVRERNVVSDWREAW